MYQQFSSLEHVFNQIFRGFKRLLRGFHFGPQKKQKVWPLLCVARLRANSELCHQRTRVY